MKRSEMIDIIHKVISEELKTVNEFNKKDCDKLLTKIEKAGMLPPIDTHSLYMDGDNANSESRVYNTWEKE